METIQIKKVDAIKAHENANTRGKKLLVDLFGEKTFQKDVLERIKTFDDVLEELDIDHDKFKDSCSGLTKDEIAYKKLKLIAEVLNDGWTPDWSNSSEYKYYPWFEMGSPSGAGFSFGVYDLWSSVSVVGSRLCFKSSKLAKYAGTQFEGIYKNFLTI